jgi:predicted RNase H-like HicB family nuclease
MVNRGETTRYKSYARHRQTTITSGAEPADDGVRFVREDELVAAIDEETGAAGCGPSRPEALAMLADALALHERDDEVLQKAERDDVLRSAGLDPDEIDAVPAEDRPSGSDS